MLDLTNYDPTSVNNNIFGTDSMYIKCFTITLDENSSTQQVTSQCILFDTPNRIVLKYGIKHFILVAFDDKMSPQIVFEILKQRTFLHALEYSCLGATSTGIKKRIYYFIQGSSEYADQVFYDCGNFNEIRPISKRISRFSLLLSGCIATIHIPKVKAIEDIECNGYCFTDGCGLIGAKLAKEIIQSAYGVLSIDYIPSVLQIRYQGCKVNAPLLLFQWYL
jgi:hypothetical protein